MDELVRWLSEQLSIDEKRARAATPGPWTTRNLGRHDGSAIVTDTGERTPLGLPIGQTLGAMHGERGAADGTFIAEHDPARVLREIDAKRRILAEVVPRMNEMDDQIDSEWGMRSGPMVYESETLLRLLAAPYVDRPGFRKEWAP